jgi:hypothetical protein
LTEEREIKKFGGTPQKNSGRGWKDKGDAVLEPFLVDVKEYAETFGVSRKVWAKLSSDALKSGRRIPALMLALGTGDPKLRLWVISDSMFKEMYEAWKEKYDGQQG